MEIPCQLAGLQEKGQGSHRASWQLAPGSAVQAPVLSLPSSLPLPSWEGIKAEDCEILGLLNTQEKYIAVQGSVKGEEMFLVKSGRTSLLKSLISPARNPLNGYLLSFYAGRRLFPFIPFKHTILKRLFRHNLNFRIIFFPNIELV